MGVLGMPMPHSNAPSHPPNPGPLRVPKAGGEINMAAYLANIRPRKDVLNRRPGGPPLTKKKTRPLHGIPPPAQWVRRAVNSQGPTNPP